MSWNFGNSLSGGGSGNSLGNLHGSLNFAPTYSTSGGTHFTPSVGRIGALNSLSTNTGINTAGLTVGQSINGGNGQVFAGAQTASNGVSEVGVGVKLNF